jgi:ComK protein.
MHTSLFPVLQNNFIITESTYAIKPLFNENWQSVILTEEGTFYSLKKPIDLIKSACDISFLSFDERRKMIVKTFGFTSKTPIPIFPEQEIFAFPTEGISSPFCEWYFANNIAYADDHESGTKITFRNGTVTYTLCPKQSFIKQWERTCRCMKSFTNYRKMLELS